MVVKVQHRWMISGGWCRADRCRLLLRGVVATAASVLLLSCFALSRQQYSPFLLRALKGAILQDDPELLDYIRNEILHPPSTDPYNLEGKFSTSLVAVEQSEYFYINMTKDIFKGMRNGVFVEAGALDGETMSNTLQLEKNFGWSGLLVEGDLVSFSQLLEKNRKAWSANVCLSPFPYPSKELMSSSSHYSGPSIMAAGNKMRAMHSLVNYRKGTGFTNSWYKRVQCLPLASLLLAADIHHVDLLVLDVEGAEMDILKTLPFDKFQIDVLYIEWKYSSQHKEVAGTIESYGYRLVNAMGEDLIFVRKDTKYDPGQSFVIVEKNLTMTEAQKRQMDVLRSKGIVLAN